MLYAGRMQITININNDTDPVVSIDNLNIDAAPIPRIVSVYPTRMTDGDRGRLWAAWHNAFPAGTPDTERYEFTRTVLGLTYDDDTSWSRNGSLTSDQVYHLIRVLNLIAEIG
jgi:hypothetical protein